MKRYNNSIVLQFDDATTGNSGAGLPVTVRNSSTGVKATLYSSNDPVPENETPNPTLSGSIGNYTFFVEDGTYDIIINEGLAGEYTIQDEQIFDDALGLDIVKKEIAFTPGDTAINLGVTPKGVNVIRNGDLQLEGDIAAQGVGYDYSDTTGIINLSTPLILGEVLEVQYGSIFTISDTAATFITKDLVRDYGAKGDAAYTYTASGELVVTSGTDDTAAMQAALADFAGGAIHALTAPDGRYWLDSAQIDLPTNTNIIGVGVGATEFIHSTTTPNQNMFIAYNSGRVSNISLSNMTLVGDKQKDNSIGTPLFRSLGTDGIRLENIRTEGGNGIWIGEDNVSNLFGSKNVFVNNIFVNDCALFGFYVRGVETPAGGFDQVNNTNNINISNLTIKGSNVGFVTADRDAYDIKLVNYNCTDSDNLMQLEASKHVSISNIYIANATSIWPSVSPTPYKGLAIFSAVEEFSIVGGYINVPIQFFSNATTGEGVRHGRFTNIDTGDVFRVTTVNNTGDIDTNKNLFSNIIYDSCNFPRDATTFFQSDTGDQGGNPVSYWRDWDFKSCTWTNDSTSNPIQMVAGVGCVGTLSFNKDCNFLGKPPRAIVAQKCIFDATVRASGITGSDIQFTAVAGTDAGDEEILRIGGNIVIEGTVEDINYDVIHDNGSYDSRSAANYCRVSNASFFHDEGLSAKGFNVSRIDPSSIGLFKSITYLKTGPSDPTGFVAPDYIGQNFRIPAGNVWMSYGFGVSDWQQIA